MQQDIRTTASLVCMFDWYCGVLKDNGNQSQLIYFELIDVVAKPKYDIKDLLSMMADKNFTLKVNARKLGTPGMAIQYVAMKKGISIAGSDKLNKYKVRRETLPKIKDKAFEKNKSQRYKLFEEEYKEKKYVSIEDFLLGKHDFKKSVVHTIEELLNAGKEKISEEGSSESAAVNGSAVEMSASNDTCKETSQVDVHKEKEGADNKATPSAPNSSQDKGKHCRFLSL